MTLREINRFIGSNVVKINAFQHMMETMSKNSNLSRIAIKEIGETALDDWEEQKGESLPNLIERHSDEREIALNHLVQCFERRLKENITSEDIVGQNLRVVRKTFETILELRNIEDGKVP